MRSHLLIIMQVVMVVVVVLTVAHYCQSLLWLHIVTRLAKVGHLFLLNLIVATSVHTVAQHLLMVWLWLTEGIEACLALILLLGVLVFNGLAFKIFGVRFLAVFIIDFANQN